MELFRQTNIDFLKYKWWAIGASWALILLGFFTIFVQKGLKFGIDFSGGTRDRAAVRGAARHRPAAQDPRRREPRRDRHPALRGGREERGPDPRPAAGEGGPRRRRRRAARPAPGPRARRRDPAKIDLNTEGKDDARRRAWRRRIPTTWPAARTSNPGDYYAQAAEQIIARRSQLGLFRSPADVDAVAGVSAPVKAWVKANTVHGTLRAPLGRERRPAGRRRPPEEGAPRRHLVVDVGMLLYIAFRFRSLPFGVGAVVALIHDTLITVGPARPVRPRVQPRRRRGAPDARRLLGERHGRRLRPDPREPEARPRRNRSRRSSTARSTRRSRGRS